MSPSKVWDISHRKFHSKVSDSFHKKCRKFKKDGIFLAKSAVNFQQSVRQKCPAKCGAKSMGNLWQKCGTYIVQEISGKSVRDIMQEISEIQYFQRKCVYV